MQKNLLLYFLLGVSVITSAQTIPPAVQAVIDAENNFARISKEQTTKTAFVGNLDENSVLFNQGNPVNGLEQWKNQPENQSYLFWWPVWADVAASGDFGYSTGPFEIAQDRANPIPTAFGYYSSVWKKNEKGEWKVVIDMGAGSRTKEENYPSLKTSANLLTKNTKGNYEADKKTFLGFDAQYISKINETGRSFDPGNLSTEARIHRSGSFPKTTPEEIKAITEADRKFQFEQQGGDVAASGDLGYAYGRVKIVVQRDGNVREVTMNYLRIWKKENSEWKIVLDVIGG